MADDIPLSPVSGWTLGPIPSHGLVAMKFDFLSHPFQKVEEAQQSQMFALTPDQARELVQRIQSALDQLESSGAPSDGVEKH